MMRVTMPLILTVDVEPMDAGGEAFDRAVFFTLLFRVHEQVGDEPVDLSADLPGGTATLSGVAVLAGSAGRQWRVAVHFTVDLPSAHWALAEVAAALIPMTRCRLTGSWGEAVRVQVTDLNAGSLAGEVHGPLDAWRLAPHQTFEDVEAAYERAVLAGRVSGEAVTARRFLRVMARHGGA